MGEQPNPWDLLQPQDKMSRHRGAEQSRWCELAGSTSLFILCKNRLYLHPVNPVNRKFRDTRNYLTGDGVSARFISLAPLNKASRYGVKYIISAVEFWGGWKNWTSPFLNFMLEQLHFFPFPLIPTIFLFPKIQLPTIPTSHGITRT